MIDRHTTILAEFGLTPKIVGRCPIPAIPDEDIFSLCFDKGEKFTARFNELANGQTCPEGGMYYYDVADILRTMQTGIEKEDWD